MAKSNSEIFTFTWKIENVSYFTLSETRPYKSPCFFPCGVKEDGLILQFFPRRLLKFVKKSKAGKKKAVLLINNFKKMRDRGILCEVEASGSVEVVKLMKQKPHKFVLNHSRIENILKRNEDTITFKCKFLLKDAVKERLAFDEDCKSLTRCEIHREYFKTTVNLRNKENRLSLMSSHFDIHLMVPEEGYFQVKIEQTKIVPKIVQKNHLNQKNRYLNGKFVFFATESTQTILFEVAKYFDAYYDEGTWFSEQYKIENNVDLAYFSCEIKTGGKQFDKFVKSRAEFRAPKVKDHLRYVSATKEYPDIVISVRGKDIAAHKIIIASKSSVLAQQIENNESCIIVMNNYDLKTVEKFLDFLYYGKLPESDIQDVSTLCRMAKFYEVDTLKAKCISLQNERNPSLQ